MAIQGRWVKGLAWLRIARLQFYPMTWLAYTLGAMLQAGMAKEFRFSTYLAGYLILFLIELCTVLVNEYNDYETDRLNNNFSMFTGGTRVLVEGGLSFSEVKKGVVFGLCLIFSLSLILIGIDPFHSQVTISILILLGLFLGLGYTIPPLKFSYRGLGEVVVSLTHSIYVILCGFVLQGGTWNDYRPWIISVPLFFSVFAAITLAGIPDRQADQSVSKKTLAVIFGPRTASLVAISCIGMASLSALVFRYLEVLTMSTILLTMLVLPHSAILVFYLSRLIKASTYERRINREMGLSLSYIIWFGLIPLLSLWR